MESDKAQRSQIIAGALCMSFWLGIAMLVLPLQEEGADIPKAIQLLLATVGMLFLSFTLEIDGKAIGDLLFDGMPLNFGEYLGFGLVGAAALSWMVILMLPWFTDWRKYPWLLLALQNLYAFAQLLGAWLFLERM